MWAQQQACGASTCNLLPLKLLLLLLLSGAEVVPRER
jgi:hypothetical protein